MVCPASCDGGGTQKGLLKLRECGLSAEGEDENAGVPIGLPAHLPAPASKMEWFQKQGAWPDGIGDVVEEQGTQSRVTLSPRPRRHWSLRRL